MTKKLVRRFKPLPRLNPQPQVAALPGSHPAMIQMTTRFSKSVMSSKGYSVLKPGEFSSKLGSVVTKGPWKGMPLFSLTLEERATCPATCHELARCYGNGMPFAKRFKNDKHLMSTIEADVKRLNNKHRQGFVVRLHVLGDFFSIDYVNFWRRLLKENCRLHIFGYSAWDRSSDIGESLFDWTIHNAERVVIRQSVNIDSLTPGMWQAATVWKYPPPSVRQALVCPAETGKTDCCATCALCWALPMFATTVLFVGHQNVTKGRRNFSEEDIALMIKLYRDDRLSLVDTAAQFRSNHITIRRHLVQAGVTIRRVGS